MRSPHAARWKTAAAAATRNRLLRGRRATYGAAILCSYSRCVVEDRRRRPLPLLHPGSGRRRRHCHRRSATLELRCCNRPAASAGAAPLMQFYCLPPSVGAASVLLGIVRGCAWGGRWPLLRAGGRVGIILTDQHAPALAEKGGDQGNDRWRHPLASVRATLRSESVGPFRVPRVGPVGPRGPQMGPYIEVIQQQQNSTGQ